MSVGIQQNVLRFKITLYNVIDVQVLKRNDELSNVEFGTLLREAAFLLQVPEKLATRHVVRDKIKIGECLERELEADNEVGVCQCGAHQDITFANGMRDFLLLYNHLLGENLHGIDAVGVLLAHLVDMTKCALANEPENVKVIGANAAVADALVRQLNAHLTSDRRVVRARFQSKPLIKKELAAEIRVDAHLAKKDVIMAGIVDANVEPGVLRDNVKLALILPPWSARRVCQ